MGNPEGAKSPEKDDKEKRSFGWNFSMESMALQRMVTPVTVDAFPKKEHFNWSTHPNLARIDLAYERFIKDGKVAEGLSMNEHLLTAMKLGRDGYMNYDYERARDIDTAKTISIEDFKENQRKIIDIKSYYKAHAAHESTAVSDQGYIKQYAKLLGADEDAVKLFFEKEGGVLDENFIDKLLEEFLPLGVCRDIATFQYVYLQAAGMKDIFINSVSQRGSIHSVVGGRLKDGSIFFMNGGNFIPVGKKTMRAALAELERAVSSTSLGYVFETKDGMFYVLNPGAENLRKAVTPPSQRNANVGLARPGLTVMVEDEASEIEFVKDVYKGGNVLLNARLVRPAVLNDHSVDRGVSASMGFETGLDSVNGGLNFGISNEKLKAVFNKTQDEITQALTRVFFEVNPQFEMSKTMTLKLSLAAEAIAAFTLSHSRRENHEASLQDFGSFSGSVTAGAEVNVLLTPNLNMMFLIGTKQFVVPRNMQDSAVRPENYRFTAASVDTNVRMEWNIPNNITAKPIVLFPNAGYSALQFGDDGVPQGHKTNIGLDADVPIGNSENIKVAAKLSRTFADSMIVDRSQEGQVALGYETMTDLGRMNLSLIGFKQTFGENNHDEIDRHGLSAKIGLQF